MPPPEFQKYLKIAEEFIHSELGPSVRLRTKDLINLGPYCYFTVDGDLREYFKLFPEEYKKKSTVCFFYIIKQEQNVYPSLFRDYTWRFFELKHIRAQIEKEIVIRKMIPDYLFQSKSCIQITEIFDKDLLIDRLLELEISYVIPEAIGNSIHRISKKYTPELLHYRLETLPCLFSQVYGIDPLFYLVKDGSCTFEIVNVKYAKNNYLREDIAFELAPEW